MRALNTKTGDHVTITVEGVKGAPRYYATTDEGIKIRCRMTHRPWGLQEIEGDVPVAVYPSLAEINDLDEIAANLDDLDETFAE